MQDPIIIFWFRRDLRLEDNAALFHALKSGIPVQPLFIFDTSILDDLKDRTDPRVSFIYLELQRIHWQLREYGSSLRIYHGKPLDVWKNLIENFKIKEVWANRDYEPYARERDQQVYELLKQEGVAFRASKDHVIFEKNEVVKGDGSPYAVYTPYNKKWKSQLNSFFLKTYPSDSIGSWNQSNYEFPKLELFGFELSNKIPFPKREVDDELIRNYHNTRDIPSLQGTSRLSVHLRFGTISIRELTKIALINNEKYLNELIWRDFYIQILHHHPRVVNENYNRKYDGLEWRNNQEEFERWCIGMTGVPIVDAGIRELNETGFMHNRVRMIAASYLTKHLLVDWRWGEAYFAEKLLDYELASNNGGWQWAASTGVDAVPYFRIFNPDSQIKRFDSEGKYIRRWVHELGKSKYPKPIVDHKIARERCLEVYKKALNK